VLDPACGTGNFLYVTLEHLKRLEGEVLDLLGQLARATRRSNSPSSPSIRISSSHRDQPARRGDRGSRALDRLPPVALPHPRRRDAAQPVLHKYNNIECATRCSTTTRSSPARRRRPASDALDGRTTKKHQSRKGGTDDTARVPVMRYVNPRRPSGRRRSSLWGIRRS